MELVAALEVKLPQQVVLVRLVVTIMVQTVVPCVQKVLLTPAQILFLQQHAVFAIVT